AVWPHLQELVAQGEQLNEQFGRLRQLRAEVPDAVEARARRADAEPAGAEDAFVAALRAHAAGRPSEGGDRKAAVDEATRGLAEHQAEVDALSGQLEALRPLAAAKEQGKWWQAAWWKATLRGDVAGKAAALESRRQQAEEARQALDNEVRRLERQQAEAEAGHAAERRRLV